MSNRKRLMLEIIVAVLLLLICAAVWTSSRRSGEQRLAQMENPARKRRRTDPAGVRGARQELAASGAQAVFRAFAAGIQGSVRYGS